MRRVAAPLQIRGARAMLGWSMTDLARVAGVSVSTIKRLEAATPQSLTVDTAVTVIRALEAVGIIFTRDESGTLGVALRSSE